MGETIILNDAEYHNEIRTWQALFLALVSAVLGMS